ASGDDLLHLLPVEDRADAVAVSGEEPRDDADEVHQEVALERARRPEIHRRRQVEQEVRGDLPVLEEFANVWKVESRGDVPVDVAHVVARDVLADVREVETLPAEDRAVVALKQP